MPEEGGAVGGVGYPIPLVVYEGGERLEDLVVGILLGDAVGEVGGVGVRLLVFV